MVNVAGRERVWGPTLKVESLSFLTFLSSLTALRRLDTYLLWYQNCVVSDSNNRSCLKVQTLGFAMPCTTWRLIFGRPITACENTRILRPRTCELRIAARAETPRPPLLRTQGLSPSPHSTWRITSRHWSDDCDVPNREYSHQFYRSRAGHFYILEACGKAPFLFEFLAKLLL